jgi:NAD(P)H-dependent FMN reductase
MELSVDEPVPPSMGQYKHEHTKTWAKKIESFDGYVFVTPEYNHGISGALKNAIDYLYREWNNKAAGFVSYGSANGVRGRASAARHGRAHGRHGARPGGALLVPRFRELLEIQAGRAPRVGA